MATEILCLHTTLSEWYSVKKNPSPSECHTIMMSLVRKYTGYTSKEVESVELNKKNKTLNVFLS